MSMPRNLSERELSKFTLDGNGEIAVRVSGATVNINVSDIQIGAVEIKDGVLDTRQGVASTATGNPALIALMDREGHVADINTDGSVDALLNTSTAWIGLATVNVGNNLTLGSNVTLNPSDVFIGLATVVVGNLVSTASINGNVQLQAGTNFVGLASVQGNVNLNSGTNYIGLASVNIGGTLPALSTGTNYIGLATVNVANLLTANVTLNNQPALVAGTAYIGLASVNIGGSLPAGSNFIGLVSTASINGDVNLSTLISGEDQTNNVIMVEQQFNYTALTSNTTLAVKATAGFLHSINVGMPSSPTISIYDSATPSGTLITRWGANYPMGTHIFDIKFTTGLSIDATAAGAVPQLLIGTR